MQMVSEMQMLKANAQMARKDLERMQNLMDDKEHEEYMWKKYGDSPERTRLYIDARVEELEAKNERLRSKLEAKDALIAGVRAGGEYG